MAKYSAGSAVSGAMTGGQLGFSVGGPVGAGVGAIIGGGLGLFGSKKKKRKNKKLSTLDERQQQLYGQYHDAFMGQGPLADQFNFDADQANNVFNQNVANPAYQGFQENIVPEITGQFRKNNIMNSSYTGEALSRAGRDVQRNLDAKRAEMQFQGQQSALDRRQNGIDKILNMQTFAQQQPGPQTPSTIDQILGTLGPKAGEWFADYLGGMGKGGGALKGATGAQNFKPVAV